MHSPGGVEEKPPVLLEDRDAFVDVLVEASHRLFFGHVRVHDNLRRSHRGPTREIVQEAVAVEDNVVDHIESVGHTRLALSVALRIRRVVVCGRHTMPAPVCLLGSSRESHCLRGPKGWLGDPPKLDTRAVKHFLCPLGSHCYPSA